MPNTNARLEAFQQKLPELELDGALFTLGASMVWLLQATDMDWQRQSWANINPHFRNMPLTGLPEQLLYIPAEGAATLLATPRTAAKWQALGLDVEVSVYDRFADRLGRLMLGKNVSTVGVGDVATNQLQHILHDVPGDPATAPCEALCAELRMVKQPEEIEKLAAAGALTDRAMQAILDMLHTGVTAYEVEEFFTDYGLKNGCSDLSFTPTCCIVETGHPTAQAIDGRGDHVPLVPGCGLAFDLGYVLNGYCSDFGRSFYYGEPPRHCADAYAALQAGQVHMIESIVPYETNVKDLYGFVHEVTTAQGFGDVQRFPDTGSLGHQIGIDCHEHPMLNFGVDFVLKPGMVFCSEPKIWLPGDMYMRVEDMVLVTEIGARSLTNFDRMMFELPVRD